MERITITLDVTKISKNKIIPRTYKLKDGTEVTSKDLKLDIVPLKEEKLIKTGEKDGTGWQLWKTHFVAEQQSKEEKEGNIKSKIIGEGTVFRKVEAEKSEPEESDEIDADSIPF